MNPISVLPIIEVACGQCKQAYLGDSGVYCLEYQELIFDEKKVAQECPMYDPQSSRNGHPSNGHPSNGHPSNGHPSNGSPPSEVVFDPAGLDRLTGIPVSAPAVEPLDISEDELRGLCELYFSGLGVTLFGRSFEVFSQKGKEEAASWMAHHMTGIIKTKELQR